MDYETGWIAALAMIGVFWILVAFGVAILQIAGMWKILVKAGKPGWAAIIPIYNQIVWLEIVGRPIWWIFLLLFVPIANVVVLIVMCNDLAKSFGKDVAYTLGLIFLGFIFFPILGFGAAKYLGPSVKPAAAPPAA